MEEQNYASYDATTNHNIGVKPLEKAYNQVSVVHFYFHSIQAMLRSIL